MRLISDIFKGHLFLFERPLQALPTNALAIRFLLAFLISGVLLLAIGREMIPELMPENPLASRLLITLALLISALIAVRLIVGQHWSVMGLRPWRDWTRREKFYAIQVFPAASVLFYFMFQDLFADMVAQNGVVGFVFGNLLFGLLWGFYQEFAYRGVLQPALTKFMGPVAGILAANLVFTFGLLHMSVYDGLTADFAGLMAFAPIFGIGLLFGVMYQRSGNLWLPAIMHGLWPLNMGG